MLQGERVQGIETVQLLVAGLQVTVPRQTGFEVFDRHRALLAEGRVETTELPLQTIPPAVLHLVLGAGSLALVDRPATGLSSSQHVDPADFRVDESFVDFDSYMP